MGDDGVWRDEDNLPLAELSQAMAVSSADGQVDDPTGGEAGSEQEFGAELRDGTHDGPGGDPDPTSAEGRRLRTGFDGHPGPV